MPGEAPGNQKWDLTKAAIQALEKFDYFTVGLAVPLLSCSVHFAKLTHTWLDLFALSAWGSLLVSLIVGLILLHSHPDFLEGCVPRVTLSLRSPENQKRVGYR